MGSHLFYAKPWDTFALLCERFLLVRKQGEFAMMASDERKRNKKQTKTRFDWHAFCCWVSRWESSEACKFSLKKSMYILKKCQHIPRTNTKKETRNINKKIGHRLRDPVTPNDPLGLSRDSVAYHIPWSIKEMKGQTSKLDPGMNLDGIHQKACFLYVFVIVLLLISKSCENKTIRELTVSVAFCSTAFCLNVFKVKIVASSLALSLSLSINIYRQIFLHIHTEKTHWNHFKCKYYIII